MRAREKEHGKQGRATKATRERVIAKERHKGRGAVEKEEAELRKQKTKRIKKQIAEGTYHVEATEVAKAIVRDEIARLLSNKR
jgi:anti-sigma28 factor (negative regulator of flagellin synthesis)